LHTASAASRVQPPGEDGQPGEQGLLAGVQGAVAPVDGGPQRLLAGGHVAGPAGQELKTLAEPGQERLGRKHPEAGGRQLDGEGQPAEAHTHLGHRCGVVHRQLEVGSCRLGPLDERR
jgi:hypothetical protein